MTLLVRQHSKSIEQARKVAEELMSYIADTNWHTFAMSSGVATKSKRLQVQIGGTMFRTIIDKEIVYEGYDAERAAAFFNGLN